MFTLNLVVLVILPIKFGLELARLPLEPCIEACRRKWPPEGKTQRQDQRQTSSVTGTDDNFDEYTERRSNPRLSSRSPYAEVISTDKCSSLSLYTDFCPPTDTDVPVVWLPKS